MPEFSSSGSEMTEFSSYIDFSVLNPPTFFFSCTNYGIPAGLSGACEILKNSIMKAFFGFMLAACLMGK